MIAVKPTILPAKSDSDVMFVYKFIRDSKLIDFLCIYPILRIGLIHKFTFRFALAQVESNVIVLLTIINITLCRCHFWLTGQ